MRKPDPRQLSLLDWQPPAPVKAAEAAPDPWHYARDLMTEEHWRDLMATRERTSWEYVANAVSHGLVTGKLSIGAARAVIAEMGWPEPPDRSDEALRGDRIEMERRRSEAGYRAIRFPFGPTGAWLVIHGIEDGWIDQRGDDIYVTARWVVAHPSVRQVKDVEDIVFNKNPDREAIVAKAKATVKKARLPKEASKSEDMERAQAEFAGTDLAEAIRRSLPKGAPPPYRKVLKASIEQQPNDMLGGRKGPAIVGRLLMFDGEEATCVLSGTFRDDRVTMSNRAFTVQRLEFRDFIQHSWPDNPVPFGWDSDLEQWRRYPDGAKMRIRRMAVLNTVPRGS